VHGVISVTTTFTVEFTKSSSRNFLTALKLAQETDGFEQRHDEGLYIAHFKESSLCEFAKLAVLVANWKGSRIMVGPRQVNPHEVWRFKTICDCHLKRQEFTHKEYYCSSDQPGCSLLFPCRFIRLNRSNIYSPEGVLRSEERILFDIEYQLRQSMAYFCPSLDRSAIDKAVAGFPKQIPQSEVSPSKGVWGTLSPPEASPSKGLYLRFGRNPPNPENESPRQELNEWDRKLKDIDGLDDL